MDIQLVTAPRTGAGVVDAVLGTAEPQIEGSSCFVSANPGGILSPSSDSLVAHRPLAERAHSGSPPASDGGEVTESAAYRETVALLNQINPEAPDTGIMWQSINLLRSLNSEEQVKVCTIGYKKCWTLPMIAVECDDWDVFETVLGMVGGFDVEAQKNIFAAKTSNETTFLKVVTGNTTDKMEKALLTFSKFGSDIQREMFLAETSGGLTLLMDVAVHTPGMLGLAFGMISGFDEITQREILMAKRDYRDYESHTYFSYTASMIVAMHAPDGIALVLDTVGKLGRDAQMALLMTATPSGQAFAGEIVVERPLWKIVAEHAPDRLALVLDTIGKLDREAQTVLLTAAISGGATFLESVARRAPSMLGRFFDMIVDGFGWAGRWEMFAAKVFSGKTFWEIVDEYVPSMLVKIFDVIDGFDGDIIRRVIMEKCQYDLTFSMFVVERIPSEFGRVLDIIGRFDGDTQREIFAMRDEESGDTLVDVAGGGYDMSADVRSRLQAMVCAANGQDHIPTNPIFSS